MTQVPEVDEKSLGNLSPLGGGGEGEVFKISSDKQSVYKRFLPSVLPELNESGLRNTISLLAGFDASEIQTIKSQTAWPHTLVRDSGRFVGFLMPLVPRTFFSRHGRRDDRKKTPTDWNRLGYLEKTHTNQNIVTDLPELHLPVMRGERLRLIHSLCRVVELLHEHDIIIGDVSGRNILWSPPPESAAIIIDCDGLRRSGTDAVTKAKQSPDWFDPTLNGDTTIVSDRYKLSLAVFRGYFSAGSTFPSDKQYKVLDDIDSDVEAFVLRGVGSFNRPSAQEWSGFVSDLIDREIDARKFDRRPAIDWRNSKPDLPAPPPAPRSVRPEIDTRN